MRKITLNIIGKILTGMGYSYSISKSYGNVLEIHSNIKFSSSPTAKLHVGTSSPTAKLEIKENKELTKCLQDIRNGHFGINSPYPNSRFYKYNNPVDTSLIFEDGRIGIGT